MTWKLKEHAVPKIQRETNDCVSVPRETKLSFLALPRPLFQVFCMNSKDWHETMRAHGNMLFVSIRTHIYHWQHGSKFSFDSRIPEFQWISSMSRTTDSRHIYRHCELVACMGTTSGPTAWIDLPFWNLHLGQRIRARTAEQARKEDVKCPAQHHTTIVNPPSVQSPRSCVAFKICKCSTWIHLVRRQQNWKFRIPNLPWNNTNKVQFLHFASATAVLYTFPFTYARWKRWTHWKRLCSTNWQLATPSVPWTACRKWIAAVSRCAPCTRLSVPAACMKHLGSEHALQPCLEQGGDLLPFLRPAALLV